VYVSNRGRELCVCEQHMTAACAHMLRRRESCVCEKQKEGVMCM